jgi:cytochrome c oxidase subunit II
MKLFAKSLTAVLMLSLVAVALRARQAVAPQEIAITAGRYAYQPDEITVHKGQPVILELTSEDVTHGLECKELGFEVTIHKGRATEAKFTPQETGRFVARCSHFCGMGHGSMTLVINVVD